MRSSVAAIVLASGNLHKAREIEEWLRRRGLPLRILSAADFGGMDGCVESALDFAGNARIKAEFLRKKVAESMWVLSDDSGLVVDALDGGPGVFSARFAGEGATDQQNRELLLERMRRIRPGIRRSARFVCLLVLARGDGTIREFRGECEGRILTRAKGLGGFGYDPVFAPEGYSQSFAELETAEKNRISHRGKALELLSQWLEHAPPS